MTQYEFVATIIAGAALVFAVVSIAVSVDANRRAHATQSRLVELEEDRERDRIADRGRADLRAGFVTGSNGQRYLRFENVGNATARDILVTLGGRPFNHDGTVTDDNRVRVLGGMFETLGAGAHVDALATAMLMGNATYPLRVTWQDDSGQPGIWEADLRSGA